MTQYGLLDDFMGRAYADCRISKGHLALYLAIFQLWKQTGFKSPLYIYSREVMPVAKISSTATYHRLIRELNDYRYIIYSPSFYKHKPSTVMLTSNLNQ